MRMRRHKVLLFFLAVVFLSFLPASAHAQSDEALRQRIIELESRVRDLEDILGSIQSDFLDFSERVQSNFIDYKKGVEQSLGDYSRNLHASIEERIRDLDDQVVVLNLASKGFRKIETNSGVFLISIQKVERIQDGYRLIVNVGNPNFAGYNGVRLKFRWGRKWNPNSTVLYEEWRGSLVGAEYSFNGKLEQGTWTTINVDITPVTTKQLEYIECSMDVESIKLNLKSPKLNL